MRRNYCVCLKNLKSISRFMGDKITEADQEVLILARKFRQHKFISVRKALQSSRFRIISHGLSRLENQSKLQPSAKYSKNQ